MKFFRRPMPAQETYDVDSASERIRLELDQARTNGKQVDCLPVLSGEQAEQCQRMASKGSGLRHIALATGCSVHTEPSEAADRVIDSHLSEAQREASSLWSRLPRRRLRAGRIRLSQLGTSCTGRRRQPSRPAGRQYSRPRSRDSP